MWAAVALILPIWLLLWHTEAILLLFHQEPSLAHEAARLVRPMMFGILPLLWYVVLRSFISALGRPGWALATGLIAVVFNALVNYVLIFGGLGLPPLGLFGAGLGSACSNLMLFLGLATVVSVQRHFRRYHLFGHFWRAARVLHDYAAACEKGFRGNVHHYLTGGPDEGTKCPPGQHAATESDSTLNNARFRKRRLFPVPPEVADASQVLMDAHFKPAHHDRFAPRMHHFDAVEKDGRVYIGYVGRHLPTKET